MNQPEELVWNEITNSAKKRFGYDEFQKVFAAFDNEYISENVLFLTIAGHAAGDSAKDIAAGINRHLLPMGVSYPIDALLTFISDRRADLGVEIKAAETAHSILQDGLGGSWNFSAGPKHVECVMMPIPRDHLLTPRPNQTPEPTRTHLKACVEFVRRLPARPSRPAYAYQRDHREWEKSSRKEAGPSLRHNG